MSMLELVKKTAFVSIGLAAMSASSIRKIGKKIAEEGKLSEAEGKKLVEDLLDQSKKSRSDMKIRLKKIVKESMDEMDLVTQKDLKNIEDKLDDIEKTVNPKPAKKSKA